MSRAAAQGQRAYVALGSNLGDREAHLRSARRALGAAPETAVEAASRVFETAPLGPSQPRYLNAVLALRTRLAPRELLERCLAAERAAGRERGGAPLGPRTLDCDLLLHGDRVLREEGLELPHPRLHERLFVVAPLADLAGELRHPVLGVRVDELLAGLCARAPDDALRPWPMEW